jgi:hypothetical protein
VLEWLNRGRGPPLDETDESSFFRFKHALGPLVFQVPRGVPMGTNSCHWNVYSLPIIKVQPAISQEEDAIYNSMSIAERVTQWPEERAEAQRLTRRLKFSRLIEFEQQEFILGDSRQPRCAYLPDINC